VHACLEHKMLVDVSDIFHLSVENLETIINGKWDFKIIQERVIKNRTKWLKNRALSPPSAFLGDNPLFVKTDNAESVSF